MPLTRKDGPAAHPALVIALGLGLALALSHPALAQARNPFGVGISEGGGPATGVMGWVLAQQGYFERALSAAVRASKADGSAVWWLAGLSFVYGVLHAVGPGHGKAVLASYMVASKRALRRGIALSFAAAVLQAAVAIVYVGVMSIVFRATAIGMRDGAALIEKLSYVAVALLGAWLVWRKGLGLVAAWRERTGDALLPFASPPSGVRLAYVGAAPDATSQPGFATGSYRLGGALCTDHGPGGPGRPFACVAPHEHGPDCGHLHAPDPATLGEDFSWRQSLSTVVAAGARPCSGAILVLVFALAQGIFSAGIAATVVMALGTAITTAALAAIAVLAKGAALRLAGGDAGRGVLVARSLEVVAALLVLAVGLSLLFGVGPLQVLA